MPDKIVSISSVEKLKCENCNTIRMFLMIGLPPNLNNVKNSSQEKAEVLVI